MSALWVGMLAAVGAAITRARPAALFRFKAIDILWGIGIGLMLRVGAGALEGVNALPFPTLGSPDPAHSVVRWSREVVPTVLVAPVIEELFFRAVLLVAIYQLLRRSVGALAAGLTAALVSAGAFVMLHAVFTAVGFVSALELFALGIACSATVLSTGRIWGAVLMHASYNGCFLVIALIGSFLS